MNNMEGRSASKRILLSGVFGPYGVDDKYGRKENLMELFHNQITKAQGIASFRVHHMSYGLYFIAENIDADVTVLDFPSKRRFEAEVAKGYDIVGISFIAPNFMKAQEMARVTRQVAPGATIIVGGHGAAIEGVEELIDCDHVAKGEGIRWMRSFLGQDTEAPIKHPVLASPHKASIYGVPIPDIYANLLVTGVGCVNGCRFCATSHFFGLKYTSYLKTGKELFDTCCKIADERKHNEFIIMDENFLKEKKRAVELLELMQRHNRHFEFIIFSSAEAILDFGVDNLVRLGVNYLWIGVESSSEKGNYEKNKGIDPKALIKELRDRGIAVLASGILCMEHHTQENIQEDIDFLVGLESDLVQFMLFTPLPVTALYKDHKKRGLLRTDLPYEEWHGQKKLAYRNPHFRGDSAERWLNAAFRQEYEVNSSSVYRIIETTFRGYARLKEMKVRDDLLEDRMRGLGRKVRRWAPILSVISAYAVNAKERERVLDLQARIWAALTETVVEKLKRAGVRVLAARWKLHVRLVGDRIQPKTLLSHYPNRHRLGPLQAPVIPSSEDLAGPLRYEPKIRATGTNGLYLR